MADAKATFIETIDWDAIAQELKSVFDTAAAQRKGAYTQDERLLQATICTQAATALAHVASEARSARDDAGKDTFKIKKP